MTFRQIIDKMTLNPRQLILIDGFGALLSAFLLGVVLVKLESVFGMPRAELYPLALAACVFAIYDFICYFTIKENWAPFLKIIAIANLVYCCVSILVVCFFYQELTAFGLTYFLLEFAILIVLVSIELKTAASLA